MKPHGGPGASVGQQRGGMTPSTSTGAQACQPTSMAAANGSAQMRQAPHSQHGPGQLPCTSVAPQAHSGASATSVKSLCGLSMNQPEIFHHQPCQRGQGGRQLFGVAEVSHGQQVQLQLHPRQLQQPAPPHHLQPQQWQPQQLAEMHTSMNQPRPNTSQPVPQSHTAGGHEQQAHQQVQTQPVPGQQHRHPQHQQQQPWPQQQGHHPMQHPQGHRQAMHMLPMHSSALPFAHSAPAMQRSSALHQQLPSAPSSQQSRAPMPARAALQPAASTAPAPFRPATTSLQPFAQQRIVPTSHSAPACMVGLVSATAPTAQHQFAAPQRPASLSLIHI